MALIPRSSMFDIDKFFDDMYAPLRQESGSMNSFFAPRVDIRENDDHYEITAELPGVKKEDVNITLDDGVLTLQAETKQEDKEEKEGKVIRQERRYGSYSRSFNLGGSVREEDISAEFDNGVLKVTAPKVTPATPERKRIEVK